ncbi:hypothetical protein [Bdellovibrio reynosensis]|uniref:Uncharacterized protein n=1 Tax=Bdellovibrio reynosensis TaxID=2835041 RepID=A0ABY4CA12_9BACT|nr:hypothetical protein [Bdellovibrio reynosensis]UOF00752.1 hypothetical protein MNR06_13700 [Bdellovibrio reynosensis]
MKSVVAFISIILFASQSFAASECAQLKAELKQMQTAQQQIMASLVNNHESFASSMEEYSSVVQTSQGSQIKGVAGEMKTSAQAFRTRGVQGKKIAKKLNDASTDLLARVASCLK